MKGPSSDTVSNNAGPGSEVHQDKHCYYWFIGAFDYSGYFQREDHKDDTQDSGGTGQTYVELLFLFNGIVECVTS